MPGWLIVAAWIVGGLVVLVVGVGLLLPRPFAISRSVLIAAPPETIHPLVDSLRAWSRWSSLDTADPDIRFEFAEPASGVGARRTWKGGRMGEGSQEIVASDPRTGVSMHLEMTHIAHTFEFTYTPEAGGTRVTWADHGEFPKAPHWRLMGTLFIDSMLGGMFEEGLARLKEVAEQDAAAR